MSAEKPPRAVYCFDRFTLDLARGALLAPGGAELALRPKSFALLRLFVENTGCLLDRDTIMGRVWPGVFVTEDSITQCVRDIRRVLGDERGRLLRTVPRRGYLLAVEVTSAPPAAGGLEMSLGFPTDQPASSVPRSGTEAAAQSPPTSPRLNESEAPCLIPEGERRQLTVLLCDLVGSTALAERLDPEDFNSAIRTYQRHCAAVVTRSGGHVANYLGDGVLAYFGYPHAQEDAAERAVRAGLAIIDESDDLKPRPNPTLWVRVGIATGLVVDGRTGEGVLTQIALGKPLNLASQLQALVEPGTVVIADSTRCLLGELFALEDLGHYTLEGFTALVRAWRVTGEGELQGRFAALRGTNLAPLVGRRQELTLLRDRWWQAKEGEGQVVLLAGEAGIGKSRLVQALRENLAREPHTYLGYHGSPFHRSTPLWPVIAQLERASGFVKGDGPEHKLVKLEALLAQGSGGLTQVAPLVASMLSIPYEGHYPRFEMNPSLQRQLTLAALVDQLVGLASRQPVLLVWEDAHWVDPTSLELLGIVIDRLQTLPVLALVNFRPEFAPPWPSHTHITSLTLNRLSRRRCGRLVTGLTGGKPLPITVLDSIVARADGVPLFVEELTRAVLEAGLLREKDSHYELESSLLPAAIPMTLQDSLMSRLDRLAPFKEVAQIASVICREFAHDLLAAVGAYGEEELTEAMCQLTAAELVFRRGTGLHAGYIFKHALIRDAAYASLLKSKRRQLHARTAQVLEERFAHIVEAEPDVLARHWTEAGSAAKASTYRLKAGERMLARSAVAEALAQLTMGLEVLQSLPDDDERRRKELELQIASGAALCAVKGQGAPETAQAYARAHTLCGELGEERCLVPVLLGLWVSHNARDELVAARAAAVQLLECAERKGDHAAAILGHRALGASLFQLGEFAAAEKHLRQLLATEDSTAKHPPVSLPYDPHVSGRAWLALSLAVLGYPGQALEQSNQAIAETDQLRHHNTTALVLCLRCSLAQFLRDHQAVAIHVAALLTLAAEQGFAYWAAIGQVFQGWVQAEAGEVTAGIVGMRRGLAACEATGAQAYVPYNLALLADMCRRVGDASQGRVLLDEAMARLARTGACYCEAELFRLDGELRLALPQPDQDSAEASFRRALEIARHQEARVVELRAAVSLARLWADCGNRQEALDLLVPIHGWFTDGHAVRDLIEAKQLLDALV